MPMPLTPDERLVLVRLEAWRDRIDTLLQILADVRPLDDAESATIRERFRALKDRLRADCHGPAWSAQAGSIPLAQAERLWYYPTMQRSSAALRGRLGTSTFPREIWVQQLATARGELQQTIVRLRGGDVE